MNERIKEFAEQASNEIADLFRHGFFDQRMVDDLTKIIQTKIKLAKADEREACAKLCEDINKTFGVGFIVVDHCAAAIRGRTE